MQSMEDSFQTSDLFDYVSLAFLSLDTRGQQSLGLGNPQSLRGKASALNLAGLPPAPLPEPSLPPVQAGICTGWSGKGGPLPAQSTLVSTAPTQPRSLPSTGKSGPGKLAQICLLQGHAG